MGQRHEVLRFGDALADEHLDGQPSSRDRTLESMNRQRALTALLASAFLTASCTQATEPVAGEVSRTSTASDLKDDTTATAVSTASPRTSTSSVASTFVPSSPTAEVLAVVDILSIGWQQHPLDVTALGGPELIATHGDRQVISLAHPFGCCFASPAIVAGPVGGPFSNAAGEDEILPNTHSDRQTLLGSGPADLVAGPSGFLAVGAWVYTDSAIDQKQTVPYSWTSEDGTKWDTHRLPGSGKLTSVVHSAGRYLSILSNDDASLAVDSSSNGFSIDALLASEDGTSWEVARELGPSDGTRRIHQIGGLLVIATVGVDLVSIDQGMTWAPPTGELAIGEPLVGETGALLLRPEETLWSPDGINWIQVGHGGPTPVAGYAGNWPGLSRTVFSYGEVVIVVSGSDFWVSGPASPWVLVSRPGAFADVNGAPPWINDVSVAADGTIIAVGATNSATRSEKPLQDYMAWSHPGLSALPQS